jgi:hypothetical protein
VALLVGEENQDELERWHRFKERGERHEERSSAISIVPDERKKLGKWPQTQWRRWKS